MRTALLTAGAFALFGLSLSLSLPATAQMCGGQQAQASTPGEGGMCGMGQTADDPMAEKPAQKPRASRMCPCCRNMAMMRGSMMGGGAQQGGGMQHHNMPGMDMPKPQ